MKIYKYKNYEHYLKSQVEANKRKISYSYVDRNSIKMICDYLYTQLNFEPINIICHGTRRGDEIKFFKEFLNKCGLDVDIIGTDISPTASQFNDTIQWDFHNIKDEWLNYFDLVYSNSFDHSYNPEKCLRSWMSCLTKSGICIIEYSEVCDIVSSEVDPFAATLDEYKNLIKESGYNLIDILTNDGLDDLGETFKGNRTFLLIQK